MAHLSPDEISRYQREGWVVPQWRLPEAQVATMRDALDELLRRNPGVRPESWCRPMSSAAAHRAPTTARACAAWPTSCTWRATPRSSTWWPA